MYMFYDYLSVLYCTANQPFDGCRNPINDNNASCNKRKSCKDRKSALPWLLILLSWLRRHDCANNNLYSPQLAVDTDNYRTKDRNTQIHIKYEEKNTDEDERQVSRVK